MPSYKTLNAWLADGLNQKTTCPGYAHANLSRLSKATEFFFGYKVFQFQLRKLAYFNWNFVLVIARDSSRQKSHYVDGQKAKSVLAENDGDSGKPNVVDDAEVREALEAGDFDDVESHVSESSVEPSSDKVFPNGEGNSFFLSFWIDFISDFLDISLASLRDSEKSVELPFSLRYSPCPQWIQDLSYILSSSTEDDRTPSAKKINKRKLPESAEKSVGTSGSRKSKRILEQHLSMTKSGMYKF